MTDSTRRAIRTGIDVTITILGALLAGLAFPGLADVIDGMTTAGATATVGVVLGAALIVVTKVRNALEDAGKLPAILKAPASDGANPVPDAGPLPPGTTVRTTTALIPLDDERGRIDGNLVAAIVVAGLVLWLVITVLELALGGRA